MGEEEYQQQPIYNLPMPRRQDNTDKNVRWKIDTEDLIKEIAHYLRGDVYDDNDLEWKSQGYVYHIKANIPSWVNSKLLEAESQGLVRFDIAVYDRSNMIGIYNLYDINSYTNIIAILEECINIIKNTTYSNESLKENITYEIEKTEPQRLVNETGIRVVMTNMRGYLNKNIKLSNLDNDMIGKMAMENALDIVKLLYMSHDKFGISKQNLSTIVRIIDVNVYSMLLSAKDGFFVHHLSTTERHIEHENLTMQNRSMEKKRGWFPKIFGNWGGEE